MLKGALREEGKRVVLLASVISPDQRSGPSQQMGLTMHQRERFAARKQSSIVAFMALKFACQIFSSSVCACYCKTVTRTAFLLKFNL